MSLPPEFSGSNPSPEEAQRQAMMEQQRLDMLSAILTPEARERLARVGLVKKETAAAVENILLRGAQSGKITNRVSDEHVKQLLAQVAGATTGAATGSLQFGKGADASAGTITISHERMFDDDFSDSLSD
jgi:programmed cell death protein 5